MIPSFRCVVRVTSTSKFDLMLRRTSDGMVE